MNAIATVQRPDVGKLIAKVGDKGLPFAQRMNSVGDVMRAMSHQMMAALPKHLTPDRMIRVALNAIRKNPKLLDCSAASLFGSITEAATYGWEIGGVNGHAYLVPYKEECVLIPGYKGMIDLCRRSGQISTISMEVVHEGDDFGYSLGDEAHIHHQPDDVDPKRDSKPITHVYCVVRLRDGGIQRSVWSANRINAHKEQYSQAWKRAEESQYGKPPKKDSFWHTAWPAAAKKTVIRDMINRGLLPFSAEYRDTVKRGLQHDDDGMELSQFEAIPGMEMPALEGEVSGEPPLGDEPHEPTETEPRDESPIAQAAPLFASATSARDITKHQEHFRNLAHNEADREEINRLADVAKARVKSAPKQQSLQGAQ